MFSNSFWFEKPRTKTEALITGLKYDRELQIYELDLLGIDTDGFSYTNAGKAWMDEEDLQELMRGGELEFPQELSGRKIKFVANNQER